MKHILAQSLMFLVVACLGVQLAHACGLCDSSGGCPYCAQAGLGAEFCVTTDSPPYCQTYYNDCSTGCKPCDGGCCASLREDKEGSCSTVKRMAWQESTIKPETDQSNHLKEFLAMADRGVFDGKRVYMHPDSTGNRNQNRAQVSNSPDRRINHEEVAKPANSRIPCRDRALLRSRGNEALEL